MGIDVQRRALFRGKVVASNAIRMPWLKGTEDFTELCTRCNQCVTACPTGIIKNGDGGYPEVDFSVGECTLCSACAEACDESLFDLTQLSPWDLKAGVSENCLNQQSVYCRSCAESCEPEAIQFSFNSTLFVSPAVNLSDCTGCGACVSVCPAKAIDVKSLRSGGV
ncbi:ferredoxin-type protein NapF [Motiliproteus sp. MSK22-1]|uniref:ferredoxin-type protein NapF n=1 Tax=Motiliproteus sp. MSK22-1 TaxID=1897630 RepID=UPI000977EA91